MQLSQEDVPWRISRCCPSLPLATVMLRAVHLPLHTSANTKNLHTYKQTTEWRMRPHTRLLSLLSHERKRTASLTSLSRGKINRCCRLWPTAGKSEPQEVCANLPAGRSSQHVVSHTKPCLTTSPREWGEKGWFPDLSVSRPGD